MGGGELKMGIKSSPKYATIAPSYKLIEKLPTDTGPGKYSFKFCQCVDIIGEFIKWVKLTVDANSLQHAIDTAGNQLEVNYYYICHSVERIEGS
jgi:hypothetical protein